MLAFGYVTSSALCERVNLMFCFSISRFEVRNTTILYFSLLLLLGLTTAALSQSATADAKSTKEVTEQLIPVTNQLVAQKCGTCHLADAKGNLSRISSVRTTPEGWEEAIKRMVRLNGLQLTP